MTKDLNCSKACDLVTWNQMIKESAEQVESHCLFFKIRFFIKVAPISVPIDAHCVNLGLPSKRYQVGI
jgi:hypothetical protein